MTALESGARAEGQAGPADGVRRARGVSEVPRKYWWPDGHWLRNGPFPLPMQYEEGRPTGAPRSTVRRWYHRARKQERFRETVEALDHFAVSKTNSIDGKVHRVRPRGGPPTAVQRSVWARVERGSGPMASFPVKRRMVSGPSR